MYSKFKKGDIVITMNDQYEFLMDKPIYDKDYYGKYKIQVGPTAHISAKIAKLVTKVFREEDNGI